MIVLSFIGHNVARWGGVTVVAALQEFIGFPLLYWVEICGVLNNIGPAVECLLYALQWMVCNDRPGSVPLITDPQSLAGCGNGYSKYRNDERYASASCDTWEYHRCQSTTTVHVRMANNPQWIDSLRLSTPEPSFSEWCSSGH